MKSIGSYEAKTHLPALLERVSKGEEFVITRHGVPIARLVPMEQHRQGDVKAVIEELKKFRLGHTLEGLSVRELRLLRSKDTEISEESTVGLS